ncbi:MAG: hypothetical protein IME94_07970 [Proteobacteria bacterium]|nr:hypothetical protein [Pseudomonadota bacterium]
MSDMELLFDWWKRNNTFNSLSKDEIIDSLKLNTRKGRIKPFVFQNNTKVYVDSLAFIGNEIYGTRINDEPPIDTRIDDKGNITVSPGCAHITRGKVDKYNLSDEDIVYIEPGAPKEALVMINETTKNKPGRRANPELKKMYEIAFELFKGGETKTNAAIEAINQIKGGVDDSFQHAIVNQLSPSKVPKWFQRTDTYKKYIGGTK